MTEYFGNLQKSASRHTERRGDVEVEGFTENLETFGRIMTTDPGMARGYRGAIRKLLQQARRNLSKDAKSYITDDPRRAARAVKSTVYKRIFGGNLSILQKRAGSAGPPYELKRKRKLDANPHQRGGNRRPRADDGRNRLDTYYGADRGFALRFLNGGTVERLSRFGNRGSIRQTDWFGHTAPWQMESAAEQLAEIINEYVKEQTNG